MKSKRIALAVAAATIAVALNPVFASSSPGGCICAKLVTDCQGAFGFGSEFKTYTMNHNSSWNVPAGWYDGIGTFGCGYTVNVYFQLVNCQNGSVNVTQANGQSWNHNVNPNIKSYPAGGTGTLSGGLSDGCATADLSCGDPIKTDSMKVSTKKK